MTTQDSLAALLARHADCQGYCEVWAERDAIAALAATPPAIDPERLARALITVIPGYARWMTNPDPISAREAAGRTDAMEAEARAHARRLIAALRDADA